MIVTYHGIGVRHHSGFSAQNMMMEGLDMNHRERAMAVLRYQTYDRLPVVHFGFWQETMEKWEQEGHLKAGTAQMWGDGNETDRYMTQQLGFDFNWSTTFGGNTSLFPTFEQKVVRTLPDGSRHVQNHEGMVVLQKEGAGSIPMEIGHLLEDRDAWEALYKPKLQWSPDRVDQGRMKKMAESSAERDYPLGLFCGSLYGNIRNWLGVEGISYLYADDEELYVEIINTVGALSLRVLEEVLGYGISFDYAHYWEDICFKNGPLVQPAVFDKHVGPWYKKMTTCLQQHGIDIVSLDCDGMIDSLIPTWFENGVNTMFPIEVGTWKASISPWRTKYGKELRGVGGMDKKVFAGNREDIMKEIERLKPLVALGGYLPCPDHRLPPDAEWDNVCFYTEQMRKAFG